LSPQIFVRSHWSSHRSIALPTGFSMDVLSGRWCRSRDLAGGWLASVLLLSGYRRD
jgi:hypothetical protein